MMAALRRCVTSSMTRAATRERSSVSPPTCLYSEGAATPVRDATAARVSASSPLSSMTASAASTTTSGVSPALGMPTCLVEEADDARVDEVGALGLRVVPGVGHHVDLGGPAQSVGDEAYLGRGIGEVGVAFPHDDERGCHHVGEARGHLGMRRLGRADHGRPCTRAA